MSLVEENSNNLQGATEHHLRDSLEASRTHAILHLYHARGAAKKIFWYVMVSGLLGVLLFHGVRLTELFLRYEVSVSSRMSREVEMVFPAVTLCNMNPVLRSALGVKGVWQDINGVRLDHETKTKRRKRGGPGRSRRKRDATCENDWKEYNGNCYVFEESTLVSYALAMANCALNNSTLVSVANANEERFIASKINAGTEYWIGYRKLRRWIWEDGSAVTFTNWGNNEPINTDNCTFLQFSQKWWQWSGDLCSPRTTYRAYICKKGANIVTQQPVETTTPRPTTAPITSETSIRASNARQSSTSVQSTDDQTSYLGSSTLLNPSSLDPTSADQGTSRVATNTTETVSPFGPSTASSVNAATSDIGLPTINAMTTNPSTAKVNPFTSDAPTTMEGTSTSDMSVITSAEKPTSNDATIGGTPAWRSQSIIASTAEPNFTTESTANVEHTTATDRFIIASSNSDGTTATERTTKNPQSITSKAEKPGENVTLREQSITTSTGTTAHSVKAPISGAIGLTTWWHVATSERSTEKPTIIDDKTTSNKRTTTVDVSIARTDKATAVSTGPNLHATASLQKSRFAYDVTETSLESHNRSAMPTMLPLVTPNSSEDATATQGVGLLASETSTSTSGTSDAITHAAGTTAPSVKASIIGAITTWWHVATSERSTEKAGSIDDMTTSTKRTATEDESIRETAKPTAVSTSPTLLFTEPLINTETSLDSHNRSVMPTTLSLVTLNSLEDAYSESARETSTSRRELTSERSDAITHAAGTTAPGVKTSISGAITTWWHVATSERSTEMPGIINDITTSTIPTTMMDESIAGTAKPTTSSTSHRPTLHSITSFQAARFGDNVTETSKESQNRSAGPSMLPLVTLNRSEIAITNYGEPGSATFTWKRELTSGRSDAMTTVVPSSNGATATHPLATAHQSTTTTDNSSRSAPVGTHGNAANESVAVEQTTHGIMTSLKLGTLDALPGASMEKLPASSFVSGTMATTVERKLQLSSCCCSCCLSGRSDSSCETCEAGSVANASSCALEKIVKRREATPTSRSDHTPDEKTARDESGPPTTQSSGSQPCVTTGRAPEINPIRKEFQQMEKLTETLADLPNSVKSQIGHQLKDFILDCKFSGYTCNISEFEAFYNPVLGQCFIFNSGWDADLDLKKTRRPGNRNGLHLIVNIQQDEYIAGSSELAGARLVVHPQTRMPFPEEEGISVIPGYATSISIRKVVIERLGQPYGICPEENQGPNLYQDHYPVNYSTIACQKSCYQRGVAQRCGCGDPYYPMSGQCLPIGLKSCHASSSEQDQCMTFIRSLFMNNTLNCDCLAPCREAVYDTVSSIGEWPSKVQKQTILRKLRHKINSFDTLDPEEYKENVLKVDVYYEELIFRSISETPAYPTGKYMADIGAILGLWVGFSVLSIFEIVAFIFDLLRMFLAKVTHTRVGIGGDSTQ